MRVITMPPNPLRRMISPSGFLLVLTCFAFPFVTVSCQGPEKGISASYSGMDLVFSGMPDVTGPGGRAVALSPRSRSDATALMPSQPLAIIVFLCVLLGIALIGVRHPYTRARLEAITSVCA